MKTKIKSVTVIGNNYFREYKVGDTVNGIKVDLIDRFEDENGISFTGLSLRDNGRAIVFDLYNLPVAVHYEEEREEEKREKTEFCPACGNKNDVDGYCNTDGCPENIPF